VASPRLGNRLPYFGGRCFSEGHLLASKNRKAYVCKTITYSERFLSSHSRLSKLSLCPQGLSKEGFDRRSFLNKKTYDYLNSVSPKNLSITPSSTTLGSTYLGNSSLCLRLPTGGLFGWPNNAEMEQKEASIKTSLCPRPRPQGHDVIYQYLKTFSIFNKRKNGILIKYNQHIGYNFNSKNILLRGSGSVSGSGSCSGSGSGVVALINKSLKTNKIITNNQLNNPLCLPQVSTAGDKNVSLASMQHDAAFLFAKKKVKKKRYFNKI